MKIVGLMAVCAVLLWPGVLRADEQTREVQEELRKRHIFFGDIDGQMTPALSAAVKQYQERKHFAASGAIDDQTLKSLGIWSPAPPAEAPADLPDVAVLKSDQRVPDKGSGVPLNQAPAPEPVAYEPAAAITRQEAQQFLRDYFDACQSRDVDDELKFYGERVEYYDHGTVDRSYIRNELVVYDQHWPERKYAVNEPMRLTKRGNDAVIRCRSAFDVSNPPRQRQAKARTNNMFELERGSNGDLQIVSIHESRVRSPSRGRANPFSRIVRGVGGTLRSLLP